MQHTAVLFDLDGVIIDTEGQYSEFWKNIGKTDFPSMPDFHKHIKGHTLKQIIAANYAGNPQRAEEVTNELHEFEATMQFPYIAGAVNFVKALQENGFKTAIVTSSDQKKMDRLYMQHPEVKQIFDYIFTAENTLRSKPAPDCYIQAAKVMGFKVEDCYVFEDSISGLQAGNSSGAIVIGLTTTNANDIIAPLCQCTINDFTEITIEKMCSLKHK